ncbi:MAG: AbrB/MazE/SpoVT family DNA-binding domain-containing protein [Candidatus Heimdallarchaeota archaeon]
MSKIADIRLKKYRVSAAGGGGLRITIPKVVADTWDLKPQDELEMILRNGKELIILKPGTSISNPSDS